MEELVLDMKGGPILCVFSPALKMNQHHYHSWFTSFEVSLRRIPSKMRMNPMAQLSEEGTILIGSITEAIIKE